MNVEEDAEEDVPITKEEIHIDLKTHDQMFNGRYSIIKQIGSGTTSKVYLCHDV